MSRDRELIYVDVSFTHSDRDIRTDFGAAAVQLVVAGPQQQDQLHSREHCRREGVLAASGHTMYV